MTPLQNCCWLLCISLMAKDMTAMLHFVACLPDLYIQELRPFLTNKMHIHEQEVM